MFSIDTFCVTVLSTLPWGVKYPSIRITVKKPTSEKGIKLKNVPKLPKKFEVKIL